MPRKRRPASILAREAGLAPDLDLEGERARSWRRIASTHALQTLLAPGPTEPRAKSVATKLQGLIMLVAAAALVALHVAHAAALWLPPSSLPPLLKLVQANSQLLFQLAFAFHGTALAAFLHWFSLKLFKHNSS